MAKQTFLVLGFLVSTTVAHAYPNQPQSVEENSPALQLARRVAAMENSKDLPSRAVWLGKKAAQNSRLAKATKKKPLSTQN